MTREIIIMAKSKKYNNYCIAGFDVHNGQWVRLVSDDTDIARAVPVEDARYADGAPVEVLDVVKVHTIEDGEVVTTASQRENVLYDSNFVWEKAGHKTIDEVVRTYGTDACDCVFGNTAASLTDEEVDGTSLLFLNVDYPIINICEINGVGCIISFIIILLYGFCKFLSSYVQAELPCSFCSASPPVPHYQQHTNPHTAHRHYPKTYSAYSIAQGKIFRTLCI